MDPAGVESDGVDPTVAAATEDATSARGRGPVSLAMLGIVLLVVGGVLGWAEDVAAPSWNLGEADVPGPVEFTATAGTYVVITSGPTRPALEQTTCTITTADGEVETDRGSEGVEGGRTRFGVTRVLEFEAVDGPTSVRCGYSFDSSGERGGGRMQVVRADSPIHLASVGLLVAGVAFLVAGIGWFVLRFVRRDDPSTDGGAP